MDERKIRLDPPGEGDGDRRCQRGGAWWKYVKESRANDRDQYTPEGSDHYSGLRLTLEDPTDGSANGQVDHPDPEGLRG